MDDRVLTRRAGSTNRAKLNHAPTQRRCSGSPKLDRRIFAAFTETPLTLRGARANFRSPARRQDPNPGTEALDLEPHGEPVEFSERRAGLPMGWPKITVVGLSLALQVPLIRSTRAQRGVAIARGEVERLGARPASRMR